MKCRRMFFVVPSLLFVLPALAQNAVRSAVESLKAADPTAQRAAMDAVIQNLSADPRIAGDVHRSRLPDALMAAARYDDAADLCLRCINAQPGRVDRVEYFLRLRVRALLDAGRNDQALAAAKSLYNVATLAGTPVAIDLVARSLEAARSDDRGVARRFKLQQIAASDGSNASTQPSILGQSVLEGISVDPSIYDAAPSEVERNREWRSLAKGNLALLGDRPDDAMAIFTPLSRSSTPQVRRAAMGAIARATKAKFGNVPAANDLVAGMPGGDSAGVP